MTREQLMRHLYSYSREELERVIAVLIEEINELEEKISKLKEHED